MEVNVSVGYNDDDFNDNETYFKPTEINYSKPSEISISTKPKNSYQQYMDAMERQQWQQQQ